MSKSKVSWANLMENSEAREAFSKGVYQSRFSRVTSLCDEERKTYHQCLKEKGHGSPDCAAAHVALGQCASGHYGFQSEKEKVSRCLADSDNKLQACSNDIANMFAKLEPAIQKDKQQAALTAKERQVISTCETNQYGPGPRKVEAELPCFFSKLFPEELESLQQCVANNRDNIADAKDDRQVVEHCSRQVNALFGRWGTFVSKWATKDQ
ncbi:hypothetical protein QOT17_005134 [Balamuthia mandrillaris]